MLIKARTCVYNFSFHLVFVTKYRKAIFNTEAKRHAMASMLKDVAIKSKIDIIKMQVMPDHVHLLVSCQPKNAPSSVVKNLKGTSAFYWFKQYPETKQQLWGGHLWSPSYFMSTIGNVSEQIVQQYIENQIKKSFNKNK